MYTPTPCRCRLSPRCLQTIQALSHEASKAGSDRTPRHEHLMGEKMSTYSTSHAGSTLGRPFDCLDSLLTMSRNQGIFVRDVFREPLEALTAKTSRNSPIHDNIPKPTIKTGRGFDTLSPIGSNAEKYRHPRATHMSKSLLPASPEGSTTP